MGLFGSKFCLFLPILNAYGIKEDVIIAPLGVKDW
jgi:hypothetical protein